jgi:transposase-like protein
MRLKKVKLRSRRQFSEEFKKARIKEYEKGEFSVQELSKLFDIQGTVIYRWIHKYSTYNKKRAIIVEMKSSGKQKLKDYEKRIAELERALGQKQLSIDFLKKMIELAEEEYQIEIKKNSDTPLSHGSGQISKKQALQ